MSFKDIKGQDKPIQILKNYIEQLHLQGSYLFVGPQGIGKKLVAKTLAKTANCLNKTSDSCDACASCLKIEKNQHPDVYLIDAATAINIDDAQNKSSSVDSEAIKIDQIRQLQKEISLKPYEGRAKVFIIDNAHNLTAEASNAFLKTLEEPPKDSLIILVTDKPALLFKTIISRCKILKFSSFKRKELEDLLKKEYDLDNLNAHFLAYFSEGRLGCALRLKEEGILNEKNMIFDKFILSPGFNLENLPIQKKDQLRCYLNILAAWFRDLYLIKVGLPHQELINFDRKDALLRLMNRFSFLDLNEIFNSISDTILYLEQNINIKLLTYNLMGQIAYRSRKKEQAV
jgi:DNA polymerase-3 subunit delta'